MNGGAQKKKKKKLVLRAGLRQAPRHGRRYHQQPPLQRKGVRALTRLCPPRARGPARLARIGDRLAVPQTRSPRQGALRRPRAGREEPRRSAAGAVVRVVRGRSRWGARRAPADRGRHHHARANAGKAGSAAAGFHFIASVGRAKKWGGGRFVGSGIIIMALVHITTYTGGTKATDI